MNTSRNNRSKRKKVIPHYFQKNHASLSDILQTASYKRRIKELLKNNKSLAVTLQDAKYRAANQQKEIEKYARTTTQISHAQLKLKDMASTIKKLVNDLDEVRGFLDVNSFNLMKNIDSSDHRLRIQAPDQSIIEESASKSILEADMSAAADLTGNTFSPSAADPVSSPVVRDGSVTEIYDHPTSLARVGSVLKGCLIKLQEDKIVKNQVTDNSASISIQSSAKLQSKISKNEMPGKIEAFLQTYKESPRKPLQALNSTPLVKNIANTFVSKIPKVSKTQPPPQQDENSLPIELTNNAAHRRETFVVKKPCSIPEVFTSAADRRGTFTISKLSEDNKCQNDRRGTYLVPSESVPPIQEEPIPNNNFVEPAFLTENTISNKTILLCEDMELTEIIPTRKQWIEEAEMDKEIPCDKNKETVSSFADEDVEFTEIVPILNLPLQKPQFQDKIIDKDNGVLYKNASPKENEPVLPAIGSPFENDCFVKPLTPKSSNTPLLSSSNSAASSEQKQIRGSANKSNSEDDQTGLPSRKSSTKRKKSQDTEQAETLKGRASSMSKRKSLVHKGSGKVSDVKPKATHRKSIAKTSLKKPVLPNDFEVDFCSDIDDELPSDWSLSNSSSPCKRRTRNKSSVSYEKFFDHASFHSVPVPVPVDKNVQVGRKVVNFSEIRQSLLPNKRTFIFTNSCKKVDTESTSSAHETDHNTSPDIEQTKQDKGVFEFSYSDSECSSSNSKPKKAKKRTKRSDSHSKKDNSNKRPRSEKVSQQQTEKQNNTEVGVQNNTEVGVQNNSESGVQNKNNSDSKKSDSTSKSEKLTLKSTSSETTDDSFVIGDKVNENVKVKELVNSKGDRIFSEFSKPSRKTISRNCKRPSTEYLNDKTSSSPAENPPNMESNSGCKDVYDRSPSKLTSPPIVQDKEKDSSLNKCSDSEVSGKDSYEGLSSRSSKVSEEKGKTKRAFSGVSERRSKKKSTLDPPDFLEEFNSPTFLEVALPKTTWLNSNALDLDCEMTEVYNFKDMIQAKVQEDNSNNQGQVSDENRRQQDKTSSEKPETLQIVKAKDAFSDVETLAPSLSKSKKPVKGSNKGKVTAIEQNKKDENSSKAALSSIETLTSPLKIVKAKDAFSDVETLAPALSKSKKPVKDSNKEKVTAIEQNKKDENSSKAALSSTETLTSPLKIVKAKNAFCDAETLAPALSKSKKPVKDSNKVKKAAVEQNKNDGNSTKAALPNMESLTSPSKSGKSKKTLTATNQEQVTEEHKIKHVESIISKVVQNALPKDVLFTKEAIAPPLHSNNHEKTLKDSNQEQGTVATKKHREDSARKLEDVLCNKEVVAPSLHSKKHEKTSTDSNQEQETVAKDKHREDKAKKLKASQSIKSKASSSHEDTHLASLNVDKSNSATKRVSIFNFETTHLDDLTSSDFVPPKAKKLINIKKDVKNKEDGAAAKEKRPKLKKHHQEKFDSEELKAELKVPASVAVDLDPRSSKDPQDLEEVFPASVSDSVPIHRQNCSGSIDSLCNVDSKGNEGRHSRRNKSNKSYKEPKLNSKMRR